MTDKIEYVLELTREEALALSLLGRNNSRSSGLANAAVVRIADALDRLDPSLYLQRAGLYAHHPVSYKFTDTIPLPKGW